MYHSGELLHDTVQNHQGKKVGERTVLQQRPVVCVPALATGEEENIAVFGVHGGETCILVKWERRTKDVGELSPRIPERTVIAVTIKS